MSYTMQTPSNNKLREVNVDEPDLQEFEAKSKSKNRPFQRKQMNSNRPDICRKSQQFPVSSYKSPKTSNQTIAN